MNLNTVGGFVMSRNWLAKGASIFCFIGGIILFLCVPVSVLGAEIEIDETQSLQEVIDAAAAGDVIKVKKGIYAGSVIISKPLSIIGEEGAVIDGEGTENIVQIITSDVTLEGLTIQHSGTSKIQSGIYIKEGQNHSIKNNVIRDALHGIYIENGYNHTISNNEITSYGEHFSDRGNGIYLSGGTGHYLENNRMTAVQDGIYGESTTNMTIIGNEAYQSRYGIHLMFAENVTVKDNHLANNITGMMFMDSKTIETVNNAVLNHFHVRGFGIIIYDSSDILLRENEIRLNSTGLSLEKTVDVQIERNIISGNQVGLEFIGENADNVFTENNFIGNVVQSKITNNQMQLDNGVKGNYWDDYNSFDVTGDGIGDITYKAGSLYDQLLEKEPYWQFFFESPTIKLWSKAETLFPSIGVADVYDENPLVEPVSLNKEASNEQGERNIGSLIIGLSFLWFSILLIVTGRRFT